MNRLWIRLSGAFALVVLVVMLIFSVMMRQTSGVWGDNSDVPPEVQAYFQELEREQPPIWGVTAVLVMVGTVAIIAGAWMSHTLTAPLSELEDAAEAIGQQNLSQRVSVKGSTEIKAVAIRFNEMAEQLEKEETLRSNLLADVAHELRNPLHILRGNLQAILDDVYPLSKEEIARLLDQTRHLTTLVDDLHDLAQAEAQQLSLLKRETDMATLVKETAVTFKPFAKNKNISLRVELLGATPHMVVDAARIRQAVHNLLNNALRHTPEGGMVTVQVEQVAEELQIRVQDSGAGIAPEQLPYVFERFYRTDSARSRDKGGTGLGLAIVKAIAEAHEGWVTAVSDGTGKGSQFDLYLPVDRN